MFDSLTWRRQMYERHLLGLDDDELDDRSDISGIQAAGKFLPLAQNISFYIRCGVPRKCRTSSL